MSSKELNYFFRACQAVEADRILKAVTASSSPHMKDEDRKKLVDQLHRTSSSLLVWLLKEQRNG